MAKEVVKRNGSRQPFDAQKLRGSIEGALADVGMNSPDNAGIVDQAAQRALDFADNKEAVTSAELKEQIIAELEALAPQAADAWRRYSKE